MIHPDTELRVVDEIVGWGVFATRRLPRGTVTWVRDPLDQAFDPSTIDALGPHWRRWSDHHTFTTPEGQRVLCWDLCRSMNHSCQPNCAGTDLGFEIALVDIEVGDELTNDYGTLRISDSEGFDCSCGREACRGIVKPDLAALDRVAPMLRAAIEHAKIVDQALAELLPNDWHTHALSSMLPTTLPATDLTPFRGSRTQVSGHIPVP